MNKYDFNNIRVLNHMNQIIQIIKNGDTWPVMIEIDLTNECSHNCIWCCDAEVRKQQDRLKYKNIINILDDLLAHGLKATVIKGGGEPTLHPNFISLVEWLGNHGIAIGIITNGSHLIADYDNALSRYCTWIKISLDAAKPETHKKVHRPQPGYGFEKIIGNVKRLTNYIKSVGSNMTIGISFCINEYNYEEIEACGKLTKDILCDYIYFKDTIFEERGYNGSLYRHKDINKIAADRIIRLSQEINDARFKVVSLHRSIFPLSKECLFTPLIACITASGNVYPCCHTKGRKGWAYGNIMEQKSFDLIWSSEIRKNLKAHIKNRNCLQFCSFRYEQHNMVIDYIKNNLIINNPMTNFL